MHRDVMSGGSPPRAFSRPQSQGAKGGGDNTTTWHAYRDPATGREYFHDPSADVTTWTLPTTLPRDRAVASRGEAASQRREPQDRNPPAKHAYKRGGVGGMRSAALAVLCVLAFNTAFLYCVTRCLVSRSTAEAPPLRTEGGSVRTVDPTLESADSAKPEADESEGVSETGGPSSALVGHEELGEMNVDTEIEIDAVSARTVDEAAERTDGPEAGYARLVGEVVAAASEEGASGGPGLAAVDRGDGHPVPVDTALEGGQEGAAPDEGPHAHDDDSETRNERRRNDEHVWKPELAPDGCWFPFSYAFLWRCRDRERREEMRMPLAGAEDLLWI